MDGIDGLAGGEAAVASSFFFLVFAYYGQSCGADRFGGFRDRRNPRTGTFMETTELPQND